MIARRTGVLVENTTRSMFGSGYQSEWAAWFEVAIPGEIGAVSGNDCQIEWPPDSAHTTGSENFSQVVLSLRDQC